MNAKFLMTAALTIALLAVFWWIGGKIFEPPPKEASGIINHEENAALLNKDRLSTEVAKKAPLTSDSVRRSTSIDSEEARALLDSSSSPIPRDEPNKSDSLQGVDFYAE